MKIKEEKQMNNIRKTIENGHKIAFKGEFGAEEIITELTAFLLHMQQDHGIESFKNINFYFNMLKDNEPQLLYSTNDEGKRIESFVVRSKNEHIIKEENDMYSYKKDIDYEKMKENIQSRYAIFQKINDSEAVSENGLDDFFHRQELKLKEIEKERQLKIQEEKNKRIQEKEMEKKVVEDFFSFCCTYFNMDKDELKKITSSYVLMENKKTIQKYLEKEEVPNSAFRFTLKDISSNKLKYYIFDKDYNILKIIS